MHGWAPIRLNAFSDIDNERFPFSPDGMISYIELKPLWLKDFVVASKPLPKSTTTTQSKPSSGMTEGFSSSLEIPYQELEFGKPIGEGGFGQVFKGTWRYESVAIKQLHGTNYNETAIQELKSELGIMARMRSNHILHVMGYSIEGNHYCLVMELMPKGSLFDLLQSTVSISWHERYQLAKDISIGLNHLHHEGILHRDLKSMNVLLTNDNRAKLCDFGLAKVKTSTRSQTRTMKTNTGEKSVGTLSWMAPELFGLKPKYSKASDIYALGIVFWELAARAVPYEDAGDEQIIINSIRAGEREDIPHETPPQFAKLIEDCWSQKPADRPEVEKVLQQLGRCQP